MKVASGRYWFLALIVLRLFPLPLAGQDVQPILLGGFQTQGSVTAGYRFTTIKGRRQKYLELFDLQKGFRLMDFNLFGQSQPGTDRFADDYSVNMSGLGGDPFPGGQLTVRKSGLYDLRVSYRQSYYYWDRNDSNTPPSGFNGLTTNHDWATVRKFGSANFSLRATNNLRFGFEFYRNSREGDTFTTRSLDYFGSSSTWGSFTRANPFYVEAPLNQVSDRMTGSVDYTRRDWTLHYRIGYQSFEDTVRGNNVTSPQRSINIDDSVTARELVDTISWSEYRNFKTPVSEFSYVGKATPALELRGDYTFYRYRGPATLDAAFNGTARTNTAGTTTAPYAVSLNTRAEASEPSHVFDQGATYSIRDWWNILFDYRYARSSSESEGEFHSLTDGVKAEGNFLSEWRLRMHQTDLSFEFMPASSLNVHTGLRYMHRSVQVLDDGVEDPVRSKTINTVWPTASVYYAPSSLFSIRGDFHSTTNGTSYTRISPHTDVGSRFIVRFRPMEQLQIEENLTLRNRRFADTGFQNNVRTNSLVATYEMNEKFSVFAGFAYDSFFATDAVTLLRGTAPLNVTWRDQTINRTWQGGLSIKPYRGLGVSFSGDYLRTTGRGEISGEVPLYGPLTYPYATGTVYYDFPTLGRLSIDLQRTYYVEELFSGDNFSANLLTIRWTRDF